jgi:hypothetical protein
VIYDFCEGRGAQFPIAFLGTAQGAQDERSWRGTLVRDEYKAYDSVMSAEAGRTAAGQRVARRARLPARPCLLGPGRAQLGAFRTRVFGCNEICLRR